MLKLVLDGANFLILDEPTNHLDILARETLEAALEAFDGTLLVVSHDRYFIGEIADRVWEIEDHTLQDYKGDYEYYLAEKEKRKQAAPVKAEPVKKAVKEEAAPEVKTSPQGKKAKAQKRYSPEDLAKQLQKVELNIREQEAMLGVLEKQMADPARWSLTYASRKPCWACWKSKWQTRRTMWIWSTARGWRTSTKPCRRRLTA